MRKGMITLLCVAGMMLWGVTAASAAEIDWVILEAASLAGVGPGPDGRIGTDDDTASGENNNCNFDQVKNCDTAGSPVKGSYSFTGIDYAAGVTNACLDLGGGAAAGKACYCAEGGACESDADCTSSSCAGAGDCCPTGPFVTCVQCTADPSTYDTFSYFGSGAMGPPPQLETCQQHTTNNWRITSYQVATSESSAGSGGSKLVLNPTNGPYVGSPCGVGAVSGTLDVDVYLGQDPLSIKGTTVADIAYNGNIVSVASPTAASACGYTLAQTQAIIDNATAASASAQYVMIMCGNTTVPTDSKTPCLRGASVDFMLVTYTEDNAADCAGSCPP